MGNTLTSGDLSEGQNDLVSYMLEDQQWVNKMFKKLNGFIVIKNYKFVDTLNSY